MSDVKQFWIRCRTCDGDGPHGWVCLPTQSTGGRLAAEHTAETGHEAWQLHDGSMGKLTRELERKLADSHSETRELFERIISDGR